MAGRFRFASIGLWIALLTPIVIEISGFRTAHLWSQEVWLPEGARRFGHYVLAFAVISAGFALFLRRYFRPILLGAVLLCSILIVGPSPVGAVLLFVFSTTILGRLAFGRLIEGPLAFMGGVAIWILAMTCVVRLPIQYSTTYLAALAVPMAIGFPLSRQLASRWLHLFRPTWSPSDREFICFALLALVLVADWLVVLKPDVSTDGLAMHMTIASNIALHHAFTIDFRQFIWALMPMGADWCYSVVYMLGGEYAARLLNFAVLCSIGLLLFGMARRFVSNSLALLTVFLFLSTPLVLLVTGSLFVENFVAAATFAAAVALWKLHDESSTRVLFLTALLLGTAVAMKLGAVAVVAVILPFLFVAMWQKRKRISPRPYVQVCALVMLIAVAALPYAYAYRRSGNPIFPFQNARFHSPYVGNEIPDGIYHPALTWLTPVMLTFRTSRYYAGQNGSFGLQYFLLLPLTLASLLLMRSFVGLSSAVIGVVGVLLLILTVPNARYLYTALPFLTLAATVALSGLQTSRKRVFQTAVWAAVAAGLWNTYYLASADWYHKDFFSSAMVTAAGRQSYLRKLAPVREVIGYVNRMHPLDPVLLTDSSSIAGLIPPVFAYSWHDYQVWKQVRANQDPEGFFLLLSRLGVRRLIVEPNPAREKFVETLLARCGQSEYSVAGSSVVNVRPDCLSELEGVDTEPMRSGRIDETDPRIVFTGNWTEVRNKPAAYLGTAAFSDSAGAEARFNLEGRGFRYTFTRAFNRGMAEIAVDGERKAIVDLYGPAIVWQAQATVAGLPHGPHRVTIRVLHQKDAAANGYYIDIDSIEPLP